MILTLFSFTLIYLAQKTTQRSLQGNTNQSPINFSHDFSLYTHLNDLYISKTSYENLTNPVLFTIGSGEKFSTYNLSLGSITLFSKGKEYEYKATEILFAVVSEHQIEGQHAQLEIQIHHTLESNSADPLIKDTFIISLLFLELESHTNEFIRTFINFRDENSNETLDIPIDKEIPHFNVTNHSISNLNKLVQKNKMFYYYEGSKTIPPFEDNVAWMIMNYFYYLSNTQYEQIKELIKKYHPDGTNNREVQTNSNTIYLLYNNTISVNMVFSRASTLQFTLIDSVVTLFLVFALSCLL